MDGPVAHPGRAAAAAHPHESVPPDTRADGSDSPQLRRSELRHPQPGVPSVARRRALERLDELHLDDAGLVLLWPFLDRFFARVGLLDEERRFIDAPAQQQAVILLELLASEDPDPPEFRLPLAKLLCGLSPADGVAFARPVAPEHSAECEHLLTAVIAHAGVLRDMPVASFRALFLRRSAVLSVRDGAWTLQVERLDHDVVLARFPWSWAWVKLPWMSDPLRVEW